MATDLVESISGARGIVGKSMTPHLALQYGLAFGSFIGGGRVVVGGDPRTSHDQLKSAVASGLMAAGRDVIDIGICPTPTIGIAIRELKARGGVGITASHNPVEWNGLKLFNRKGEFISPRQYEEFKRVKSQPSPLSDYRKVGRLTTDDSAVDRHINRVLSQSILNIRKIRLRKFKVVVDCVNGGGYIAAPELLRKLGCTVIVINGTPDGKFPRGPEPIPKHLTQLRKKVVAENADIGFALDPDADRLAVVSDEGKAIGEEHTLALALMAVLSKRTGPVVVNMSTSRMCRDVAEMYGCKFFRSKVGEANVVDVMRRKRSVIGGEGNGGVILPTSHYGRDSLMAMALVLQQLADARISVSSAIKAYPNYVIVKDKGELPGDFDIKLQNMKAKLSDVNIDETDGIRIDYSESWVHIRRSNTEPIFRIISEARSRSSAVGLVKKIKGLLN
jgi:phosphomannomutase